MLNILSQQQQNPSLSLRYIVPLEWWKNILALNSQVEDPNDLVIENQLQIFNFIQMIESTEREAFIRLVGRKVAFLEIDNLILNPKLKTATKWKTVSTKLFELLKTKLGYSFTLPFISLKDIENLQNESIQIDQNSQFKIIKFLLCSNTQNHLFYGYVDLKVEKKNFIEQMITRLEYFSTQKTKVTFLQTNELRNYKFQDCITEFEQKSQLIMVHGLQRYDQGAYEQCPKKFNNQILISSAFESPRLTRIQRNGDQLTMADEDSLTMSEHTMSTGAETPFSFGFEEQDWDLFRPYHKYALFGEKLEQEIQHMKQYARQAICTDIIHIPIFKQQLIINQLNRLSEDIQQNIEKKKIYQKQIAKDTKQYFKDYKETHHLIHCKDTEVLTKDFKQTLLNKTMQSEHKIKDNIKPVIYFSLSNQNN